MLLADDALHESLAQEIIAREGSAIKRPTRSVWH
jgi:hypothetical protein